MLPSPSKMNEAMKRVVATFKPTPKLTHKQEVMRLYRRYWHHLYNMFRIICLNVLNFTAVLPLFTNIYTIMKVRQRINLFLLHLFLLSYRGLRLLNTWCESRILFNEEATKMRAKFDAHMNYPAGRTTILTTTTSSEQIKHLLSFISFYLILC